MAFCIRKDKIDEFKKALKNRDLDIFELMKKDGDKITEEFKKYAPDEATAKQMSILFQQKLILKNRIQGIKNFINKTGEMGRYDPLKKAKLDQLLSEFNARQQERMLNPKENEGFLNDLVEEKLGVRVTKDQAKVAWDIQTKAEKLFENFDTKTETWKSKEVEAEYGATKVIFQKYIAALKTNGSIRDIFKGYSTEVKQLWKENRVEAIKKAVGDSVETLKKTMINAVASWDNSYMGRQGVITLMKSPKTWWKMAKESMNDFYAGLKGNADVRQDALLATVYSHPDYINGKFEKSKLSFGIEEEVPIAVLERTPVLGKLFKASDISFVDSAIRARLGLWDIMGKVDKAKKIELDDAGLRDRGKIINSITARGRYEGKTAAGTEKFFSTFMWAPKMLKADWDILTAHSAGFGLETKGARVEALKTVVNVVIATAAISAIAEAMGAEVEKDPRSTNFLKIKKGNTKINTPFARGMPQLVTLFSRLLTGETKNSSGVITKLNSGKYGSDTLFDVGVDFLVNKTTPPVSAAISWLRGSDHSGKKPTIGSTAENFLPISVQNFTGLRNDSSGMAVFGAFVDFFGVGSNTYKVKKDFVDKAKSTNSLDGMVDLVKLYVKAFESDPSSAIKTLFTEEQLKDVRGGAVIMERMGLQESQAVKKKGGASKTDKLDHIVPLELGGDNSESNLRIVTNEEWKSYTLIENHLGDLLNEGKISEKKAQELIRDFKNKKITADDIYKQWPK